MHDRDPDAGTGKMDFEDRLSLDLRGCQASEDIHRYVKCVPKSYSNPAHESTLLIPSTASGTNRV